MSIVFSSTQTVVIYRGHLKKVVNSGHPMCIIFFISCFIFVIVIFNL